MIWLYNWFYLYNHRWDPITTFILSKNTKVSTRSFWNSLEIVPANNSAFVKTEVKKNGGQSQKESWTQEHLWSGWYAQEVQ